MSDRERYINVEHDYDLYEDQTDPALKSVTTPMTPRYVLSSLEPPSLLAYVGIFLTAIVRKINQLVGFAVIILVLLLLVRFLITFFGLTMSLFVLWTDLLTNPLVLPFNNLLPPLLYAGYTIDLSLLIAIGVYVIAGIIVRLFLKILITQPK